MTQQRRAFTLIEVLTVIVLVGIASALALASSRDVLAAAKYRADRAKLFLEISNARDASADQKTKTVVFLNAGTIEIRTILTTVMPCNSIPDSVRVVDVPALKNITYSTAGAPICFDKGARATFSASASMSFNDGSGPVDFISSIPDGRLADSWGEFGTEGALEATACDVDEDPLCGK